MSSKVFIQYKKAPFFFNVFYEKRFIHLLPLFIGLLLFVVLISACSNEGRNQTDNETDYQSEYGIVDCGGRTIRSDQFISQVFIGQPVADGKSEEDDFTTWTGAAAPVILRMERGAP